MIVSRSISSSARITDTSADWMPERACDTLACADWIVASALSRAASALAARVSEPKPDALSREAALASISAAASCARAPAS